MSNHGTYEDGDGNKPIERRAADHEQLMPRPQTLPMQIASVLLAQRRLLLFGAIGGGLLSLVLAFVLPPVYVATATFIAESRRTLQLSSGLASIAAQFGIPSIGAARQHSPEFYVELIRSDRVLRDLLETEFRADGRSGAPTALLDLLEIEGDTRAERLARGVRALRDLVRPSVELRTGIIVLEVEMPWAPLSAAVANRLVVMADQFNHDVRQTRRQEHRRFIEERLAVAERELAQAEGELRTFLEENRRFGGSPTKQFEEGRLNRQVDIAQEVYLTLRRELETARIEEQDDVPVLTVVDPALPPQRPAFPRPVRMIPFGVLLGLISAAAWAFLVEYVRDVGARDPQGRSLVVEQLRRARGEAGRLTRLRKRTPAGR